MEQYTIDKIRELNNIVDVIGGYVQLRKTGSGYKGLCPFHQDTNPSLSVSETKQIYKCFVCGKAGNVFTFVQDYEHISFIEAAKKLAERVGLALTEEKKTKVVNTRRDLLLTVYKLAKDHYKENLEVHGDGVKKYLLERQINQETIDKFELGYALNSYAGLKNYLIKQQINTQILESSGLFSKGAQGLNDLFRERLMFPIHSHTGDVIAFGGRIINAEQQGGKYINSPTTELYTKGKELYGLYQTRYEISKSNMAILCEGYLDFLRLYGSGFTNCVASLGTSLTSEQAVLLRRYTQNVMIMYDGDVPGKKAAVKAAQALIPHGLQVKMVSLPSSEDPDSFLIKQGEQALKNRISVAEPLVEFLQNDTEMGFSLREKIDIVVEVAKQIGDPISKDMMVHSISEAFHIKESTIRTKNGKSAPQAEQAAKQEYKLHDKTHEWVVLWYAIHDQIDCKTLLQEANSDYFNDEMASKIYLYLRENFDKIDFQKPLQLIDMTEDEAIRMKLTDLLWADYKKLSFTRNLNDLKKQRILQELAALEIDLNKDGGSIDLQHRKTELQRKLQALSTKVVRKALI